MVILWQLPNHQLLTHHYLRLLLPEDYPQFGGVPMNLELRLSVEDSPNSAGVAIDMIRCAKLAKDRGLAGPIDAASAYFCKHPRTQMTDDIAQLEVEKFIAAA